MFKQVMMTAAAALVLASPAMAEMFEVKMLNRGDAGRMIFEPAQLRVAPGDTVRFLATDRGHNAESVDGMIPAGAEVFSGAINEEIEITLTEEGFYGIRCTPHFAMGMVMTIAVGDVAAPPDDFLAGRIPRKAKERFEEQIGAL